LQSRPAHRRKKFLNIGFLELVLIQPRLAETAMLQSLSEEIRECLRRAEKCKRWAKTALTPSAIKDYLDMEQRWLNLARSYEFSERLSAFTKSSRGRNDSQP
jgi:hypothetical protein